MICDVKRQEKEVDGMIRLKKRLRDKEKLRLDALTEEAKARQDVSAELFLESELNAFADADCFFFYGCRRRPAGLLTVFFPDETHAEITAARFCDEEKVFPALFRKAMTECGQIGIESVYTVVDPAWGFDLNKVKGMSFVYEKSEYMLGADTGQLANLPGEAGEGRTLVAEDMTEDGTIRYMLVKDGTVMTECRILPMEEGKEPYLFGLKTGEEFRRQGLATILIREVAKEYGKFSGSRLRLQVASDNVPAVTLYRKLGFVTEEERAYYKTEVQ